MIVLVGIASNLQLLANISRLICLQSTNIHLSVSSSKLTVYKSFDSLAMFVPKCFIFLDTIISRIFKFLGPVKGIIRVPENGCWDLNLDLLERAASTDVSSLQYKLTVFF